MKTKHIQYRSALLIGLLSLNTLSSCAHTSRGLGMGNTFSRQTEHVDNRDSSQSNTNQGASMDDPSRREKEYVDSSQAASRFSWARSFSSIAALLNVEPVRLLWVMECAAIGYGIGYAIGYTPACVPGSLPPYPGSGV